MQEIIDHIRAAQEGINAIPAAELKTTAHEKNKMLQCMKKVRQQLEYAEKGGEK